MTRATLGGMSRRPGPSGPSEVPAWVTRGNEAIERVLLLIRVSLLWALLSLLGLVVLGVAPASVAAADALIASRHGAPVKVLPTMWRSYREHLVTSNLRMLPLLVVQVGSAAMLWIVISGGAPGAVGAYVLGGAAMASLSWATASLAAIVAVPRIRRQDVLVTWRLALLVPGATPMRFLALTLCLGIWIALCSLLWPVAVLLGAGAAIDLAVSLLGRRLELLLEDLERSAAGASASRTGAGGSSAQEAAAPR